MNYNIQQLEYIVALDNFRSFSLAAEHCHVTQPTLSMQVKKLEEDMSVNIFDRSKKPLIPTSVGKEVIEQARKVLAELAIMNELVSNENSELTGALTIGIIPTLAPYLVPLFIGSYLRDYPDVEVRILEMKTEEIVSSLKKEQIDLGILATPLDVQGLHEIPLFYEKMISYVNNELVSQYPNKIGLQEILEHKIWLLSQGNCFRNQVFNLCALDQIAYKDLNLKYESGSIEGLMRLVDQEGGITLVPELATLDFPEEKLDQLKFIGDGAPVREISLVLGRKTLKKKLVDSLKNEIISSLPTQIADNEAENVVSIN
ncbi:MAG: LysR substrate-binding domain-containing protein [bacterium]|nr:LysR substrate-binding domain-containing protein [bacterium]